MGNTWVGAKAWLSPSDYPNFAEPPTFDPNYGFPEGRKPREVKATYEEVVAAKVPQRFQDYCVDYYIKFAKCRRENTPLIGRCNHERHDWDNCRYEDVIMRMKEYEREKRLKQRANRRQAKGLSDNLNEE